MTGRRPLVEHVGELRRHMGSRRSVRHLVLLDGISTTAAVVPGDLEVDLAAVLESIPEGIVVTGTLSVPWQGECRRCLGEASGTEIVELREIFEVHPTEGETWPLEGDEVDLEPLVRETALISLPLAPLCSPDCKGPAPEAAPVTVEGEEAEAEGETPPGERPRDPRWAALDVLRGESEIAPPE